MTLDDLERIYDEAKADERNSGKRAGIRAVVVALRGELDPVDNFQSWNKINDILGDAGEKAAGNNEGYSHVEPSPAADPSPEVCEWTLQSVATADVEGFNGVEIWRTPHKTVYFHEVGHKPITCGRCSKPIVFKEARP